MTKSIRGIRDRIPPGHVLGRMSGGQGPVELLNLRALAQMGVRPAGSVSPGELAATGLNKRFVEIAVYSPSTTAATGDGKAYFRVPAGMAGYDLTAVTATVSTASTTAGPLTVQIARIRGGVAADVLSTALTIDDNETDSNTAATAAVIDATKDDLADADVIRIDIDVAGTGAKGLLVCMTFTLPT